MNSRDTFVIDDEIAFGRAPKREGLLAEKEKAVVFRIFGPVSESTDDWIFFGHAHPLPLIRLERS